MYARCHPGHSDRKGSDYLSGGGPVLRNPWILSAIVLRRELHIESLSLDGRLRQRRKKGGKGTKKGNFISICSKAAKG